MTSIRLFIRDVSIQSGQYIYVTLNQAHYLYTVMRCNAGDKVFVFNGVHGEWLCTLEKCNSRAVVLKVINQTSKQILRHTNLQLAYAPTKNVNASFIVQKATELGVNTIQPIITNRTIVRKVNIQKLTSVAIEAAEQCNRMDIPQIMPVVHLSQFMSTTVAANHQVVFCNESEKRSSFKDISSIISQKNNNIILLIGPEGGFTTGEKECLMHMHNVHSITLSRYILRAETAAITALSIYQYLLT